jgi:hypothetical protein
MQTKETKMKALKKTILGAAVALAMAGQAHAIPINVGGVVWDPDAVSLTDSDFTARFEFNQWFTSAANQVPDVDGAAANYANAINPGTVGLGDTLQGVGEIFKLNGVNYGNTASLTGGAFCPSCELTFTFGGFSINGVNTLSNGWLRIYVDDTPDWDVTQTSAAGASDGTLFLELRAGANTFNSNGGFSSGSLFSYFDAVDGIALSNFDTNTVFGFDFLSSASASFFQNVIATSTGQINGNSIPEPGSLALAGLGLLGLGALRRRKAT